MTSEAPLSVPEYYADKKILLTGATGFLGKVYVEKLLRCCPEIAGIYCIVRPKKEQDARERLDALWRDEVSLCTCVRCIIRAIIGSAQVRIIYIIYSSTAKLCV